MDRLLLSSLKQGKMKFVALGRQTLQPPPVFVVDRYRTAVDAVLFNLCWFANAYGAHHHSLWIGPTVVCLSLAVHLYLVESPRREGVFVMIVASLGYLLDSSFQQMRILQFADGGPLGLAPTWLFFQWASFSLLFDRALVWLRDRPYQAALLGLLGGPSSYYAATSFGILTFGDPLAMSLALFGGAWALLFPFLLRFSNLFSPTSAIRTVN